MWLQHLISLSTGKFKSAGTEHSFQPTSFPLSTRQVIIKPSQAALQQSVGNIPPAKAPIYLHIPKIIPQSSYSVPRI